MRRWGGAVGSPQTAAELNDLKAHMTWLYGGTGNTPLQIEMQNSRGYHTDNLTLLQIEAREQLVFILPIEGLHATPERGRESLYIAAVNAGTATGKSKSYFYQNCVVCAYELLNSKEKMKIVWNTMIKPSTTGTIFEIISKSDYSSCSQGGCVKCGLNLCQYHFENFDHSDIESVKYRNIIFPIGKKGWADYCEEDELNFWDETNKQEIKWHNNYRRLKVYVDINKQIPPRADKLASYWSDQKKENKKHSAHRLHLIEQINNVILCGKCGLNHHHREVKRRCACKKVVEDSEPQHEPYSDDDNKEGDNEDKDSNGIDDEIVRIAV